MAFNEKDGPKWGEPNQLIQIKVDVDKEDSKQTPRSNLKTADNESENDGGVDLSMASLGQYEEVNFVAPGKLTSSGAINH